MEEIIEEEVPSSNTSNDETESMAGVDPPKANRKAVRLAHQAALLEGGMEEIIEEEVPSSNTSNDETESMAGVDPPPRRTLGDYGQTTGGHNPNLGFQPVNPVSFDIKNTVLSALKENQFSGSESECPNIHLARFYEACGYTDPTSVSESNKKLRLFPLSLTGRAKNWIDTLPPNTIATWDELELKFRERYFPIHKFLERRMKMQHFTQGLRAQTRMLLDASAGGSLKNKDESEARELVEAMAQNEYRVQNDRGAKKKAGMLELDTQTALLAQSHLMNTQMAAMLKHFTTTPAPQMQANAVQDVKCAFCGKGHANGECFPAGSEQAMYLSNFKKSSTTNNTYSNTYNPGWRDHPNFGWGGNQNQSQQQAPSQNSQPRQQSPLEDALAQFIKFAATQNKGFEGSTKDNPTNESCMAINLRSREVPSSEVVARRRKGKSVAVQEDQKEKEKSIHAKLPYPRKKKAKEEDPTQFEKFMKMLHSLQMNIPFAEALEQMSVYAKFMKELLTKKRKPLDDETVNMTEECSAIIQKKLPQKKKDPRSFIIPCSIGNLHVRRALCDLGASINLMPLSMMKRIPGVVAKPTKMQLSLADRSITHPYGILQNVLVRCAEFVFPADFVILDMEEDAEVPLLLGRPFLATRRTLIDVEKGELVFRLDDEQICFQVFEATTFGGPVPEYFKVDVLEEVVNDAQEEEWEHEIELFLQNLDDEGKEEEPLNLEGALVTEALKKDDSALVWELDGVKSPFCLQKKTKEEEVKTGIDAYLEGANWKYPP
ncbi:hypothetical protein TSUD_295550 [Trifolium subterraneum]|uniref:Retrotransposon gag domain-containing protein n=1 Tax=Trifolium subterraneum TaxID=3900 RepID=A0A2Z6M9E7_TRISU|nr:hypothetical protein TSUD_295550 [Trifolium subterraneum]